MGRQGRVAGQIDQVPLHQVAGDRVLHHRDHDRGGGWWSCTHQDDDQGGDLHDTAELRHVPDNTRSLDYSRYFRD